MYSKEQKDIALRIYHQTESVTETIRILGYPTRRKAQMQDMQLEIDILKETINVLKKDPDIDQSALSNREKAVIIDVLKNRYSLPLLLQKLQLSKSSYYYQEQSLQKEDKYTLLRVRVIELFTENKGRYGCVMRFLLASMID